ncbi:hypothetical protein SDC9_168470 [bioreactor metagenome]|uniref:Uncharacterized protein n=1 Tax=bioreactor metagenome TaxID=1076179 RepID=A0A645G2M4_9ZZZZ
MALFASHRPNRTCGLGFELKALGKRKFILGFSHAAYLADIAQLNNGHALHRKGGLAHCAIGNGTLNLAAQHPNNVWAVVRQQHVALYGMFRNCIKQKLTRRDRSSMKI